MNGLVLAAVQISNSGLPKVNLDQTTIQGVLSTVFMLIGGIATLFLLIGAVKFVLSQGDAAEVTKSRNTILYAVIGIVVSMSAFVIVQFVLGRLG